MKFNAMYPATGAALRRACLMAILLASGGSLMTGCGDPEDPAKNNTKNNDKDCTKVCDTVDPQAASCDGTTALTYTVEANLETCMCDSKVARTNCADSGKVCMEGQCVDETTDPCAGVTCDMPPAAKCDGTSAVTYSAAGTCSEGDCAYAEMTVNCADTQQVCSNGACVAESDPCVGVTCDMPPAATCEGNMTVTYAAAGTCSEGDCSYDETKTDCGQDKTCMLGQCMDNNVPPVAPVAGELLLTEVMYDPALDKAGAEVIDDNGEWFELYNKTDKALNLEGLILEDSSNADAFTVPAGTILPAKSYIVFGLKDDVAINGNVMVNVAYSGFGLNNGGDTLRIKNGAGDTLIEFIYDGTWPDPTGATLQFDGSLDLDADHELVPAKWCEAPNAWDGADKGSPGVANPACPPPAMAVEVTIKQIQDEADAMHPMPGTKVLVKGVVITASGVDSNASPHAWAQDVAGGEYSGIYLDVDATTAPQGVTVGTTTVDIEGTYEEQNGNSAIKVTSITNIGNAVNPVTPVVVSSATLADPVEAEKWEGVLIRVNEAGVTDENADAAQDFGEFRIDNAVRVNDLLFAQATPESLCDVYAFIAGPLNFGFGNYKIEPRDANDYGASTAAVVVDAATADVAIASTASGFTPSQLCVYKNTALTWTNNDGIAHTATSRDATQAAPNNIAMTPAFDVALAAGGTGAFTFADAGTFHYRCRPHASMNGVVVVLEEGAPTGTMLCGNGMIDGMEACDGANLNAKTCADFGGMAAQTLSCKADCTFDTSACQGMGGAVLPSAGDLIITEIMQNPTAAADSVGEWFEIYNASANVINLDGLVLKDDGADTHTVDAMGASLVVQPGAYFIFGNNDDMLTNGGVNVGYKYASFTLANGDDEVVLVSNGTEVARAAYDGGTNWPDPAGASMQLDAGKVTPAESNDGDNWCPSSVVFGSGDSGTPGAANTACP